MPRASRYPVEEYAYLNRRKGHEGPVREHAYQYTMIRDGRHLLNCM